MLWLRDRNAVAGRIILRKVWGQERSRRKGEAGEWQELIFAVKRTQWEKMVAMAMGEWANLG